ncbi:MAG: YfbM family protein [Gemmataceae bacterium]|nr:YfbM family protein [Gemmataceae bacterium]MCI0741324.1 YfbM family protein [Gemmataceae bacterium]
MSVIANYVRVSDDQLMDWRSNPDLMNSIASGVVSGAEHCDVDTAYQAIAWLLSPVKREEQRRQVGAWPDTSLIDPDDSAAWAAALTNAPAVDYSGLEPDLLLTAIEGRVPDEKRDAQIQYGLGAACVFLPVGVQQIDDALRAITPQAFGQHFSAKKMMEHMVEPEIWDEGEAVLDEFLRPAFERLRGFFGRAAAAKQNVVIVYT